MARQLDLFNRPSLNVGHAFKECLARIVADSGLSREAFLERLNITAERFGVRLMKGNCNGLTMATFEKWLNVDQPRYMPPIAAIPVICEVGGSIELLQILAGAVGAATIGEDDRRLLRWAKEYHKAKAARTAMKRLESEL
jgi:hypothetical protein